MIDKVHPIKLAEYRVRRLVRSMLESMGVYDDRKVEEIVKGTMSSIEAAQHKSADLQKEKTK